MVTGAVMVEGVSVLRRREAAAMQIAVVIGGRILVVGVGEVHMHRGVEGKGATRAWTTVSDRGTVEEVCNTS